MIVHPIVSSSPFPHWQPSPNTRGSKDRRFWWWMFNEPQKPIRRGVLKLIDKAEVVAKTLFEGLTWSSSHAAKTWQSSLIAGDSVDAGHSWYLESSSDTSFFDNARPKVSARTPSCTASIRTEQASQRPLPIGRRGIVDAMTDSVTSYIRRRCWAVKRGWPYEALVIISE